ncbi:MAG: LysR family transcriptional regulator, partial [Proteobacteria bacterium]|nr:LysR family transcriptional regulator [Pseudomonadota bacterium]
HAIVGCSAVTPLPDRWTFRAATGAFSVALKPRLIVNTTEAAADAAANGLGLACLVSYQAAAHLAAGRLVRVLAEFEPPPIPIHIVHPAGRHVPAKVRAFIDTAGAVLRERLG